MIKMSLDQKNTVRQAAIITLLVFFSFLLPIIGYQLGVRHGVQTTNAEWEGKAAQLAAKVKELESRSAEVNTVIKEKIVVQRVYVRGATRTIIKRVASSPVIIKYKESCTPPAELIDSINEAAAIWKVEL